MSGPARTGIIAWFARNPVAANLLMLIIMAAGLGSAFTIQRAMFPVFEFEMIIIETPYPGAAPEEVEKGEVRYIEEDISDVYSVNRVEADAFQSQARF